MGPAIAALSNRRKQAKTSLFDWFAVVVTGCPIYRFELVWQQKLQIQETQTFGMH